MRLLMKLLVCLSLLPVTILCQEGISRTMVGPYNGQIRVIVAFMDATEDTLKTQTLIFDLTPIKTNQEQPSSVLVDLTSTIRSLKTGNKNQKILQFRWNKNSETEFRCEGKWQKKETAPPATKIIEAVNSVIQVIPLDTKEGTQITLKEGVEKSVISLFETMTPENFPCLRMLK